MTCCLFFQKFAESDDDDDFDVDEYKPLSSRVGTGRAKPQVKYNFGDDDEDSDY